MPAPSRLPLPAHLAPPRLAPPGAAARYRVRAELADGRLGPASSTVELVPTHAAGVFGASGLVEGFYGPLWSWEERKAVVRELGRAGLDTYVYAMAARHSMEIDYDARRAWLSESPEPELTAEEIARMMKG